MYSAKGVKGKPKVAVLIYGMLREYRPGFKSFDRHILTPNDADVFYYGPSYTDRPDNSHYGVFDNDGFLIENPKSKLSTMDDADVSGFIDLYGKRIKSFLTHDMDQDFFVTESEAICGTYDWMYRLNPARALSMFYNISGVIDLFLNWIRGGAEKYDICVITRSDLVFYDCFSAKINEGEVHIPKGQGFNDRGEKYNGNAPVYFYKNITTGEFIEGGRRQGFNDQFMVLRFSDVTRLSCLYEEVKSYIRRRVPVSPETLLYLAFKNRGIKVVEHEEWPYEIFRSDTPSITNIIDSPELWDVDRHHPRFKSVEESRDARIDSEVAPPDQLGDEVVIVGTVNSHVNNEIDELNYNKSVFSSDSYCPTGREVSIKRPGILARFCIRVLPLFLNDRHKNKLAKNPELFFKDSKSTIARIIGRSYLNG